MAIERELNSQNKLWLVDEWLGIEMVLNWNIPGDIWVFQIYIVLQSEFGYELVYQNSSVIPKWSLNFKPGEHWCISINKSIKTFDKPLIKMTLCFNKQNKGEQITVKVNWNVT